MHELGNLDSVLAAVTPDQIREFLLRRDFGLVGERAGVLSVFENAQKAVVAVPQDRTDRNYARRLRDILSSFVNDTTPLDDVVASVVLPDHDVFRYRIQTPEATWGHVRLWYASEAMPALFNVLKFTAAGVHSRKLDYTKVGDTPKAFVDQCKFGQTEYGSFVMKVYCPTNPVGAKDVISAEPFGRTTTRALLENFAYLSSDKAESLDEPPPPTMNRQVASAVANLNPQASLGVASEVMLRYSDTKHESDEATIGPDPSPRPGALDRLDLGQFIYSRAASVRDRFAKAEEFGRELLRGFITDLHKDRPNNLGEQSHEITLSVKWEYRTRQVRMRLLPSDYRKAVRWHDDNTEVDLDAKIDKRGHVWTVAEVYSLTPTKAAKEQTKLFPEPE
jgi:hypothetical protein